MIAGSPTNTQLATQRGSRDFPERLTPRQCRWRKVRDQFEVMLNQWPLWQAIRTGAVATPSICQIDLYEFPEQIAIDTRKLANELNQVLRCRRLLPSLLKSVEDQFGSIHQSNSARKGSDHRNGVGCAFDRSATSGWKPTDHTIVHKMTDDIARRRFFRPDAK